MIRTALQVSLRKGVNPCLNQGVLSLPAVHHMRTGEPRVAIVEMVNLSTRLEDIQRAAKKTGVVMRGNHGKLLCILFLILFVPACGGAPSQVPEPTSIPPTPEVTLTPKESTANMTPTSTSPTSTPTSKPGEVVSFNTADGVRLAGTLFGQGETAVILAHQGTTGADQTTWHPFASLLAGHGYTALAFDFRGVGQSEGNLRISMLGIDVQAAVDFLQARGYRRIVCIGASMGGTACLRAAQDYPFSGLVILASTMVAGGGSDTLRLSSDDLDGLSQPKLFITAEHDFSMVVNDTRHMYDLSPQPKDLLLLPGTQHGTILFSTEAGEALTVAMLDFLDNLGSQESITLPALQPITVENAAQIRLLRTMQIPDYRKGQVSQCSLAFSPDGSLLVGACGKNPIPVWQVGNGEIRNLLYDGSVQIVTCAFSPNGEQIACGGFDRAITLWDASTGQQVKGLGQGVAPLWELAFSADGKSLLSCSLGAARGHTNEGQVIVWDLDSAQPLWSHQASRDYLSLSIHPSGETVAYGTIGGSVGILDLASGTLQRELTDSRRNIGDLEYSPSGDWLAAGSDDNLIYMWDTTSYELAAQLQGHRGYVNGVAFSPNESLLVSGSHDKTLGVWNLAERQFITSLQGHEDVVLRVAFNPEGTLIASISWDGTVRLWGVSR